MKQNMSVCIYLFISAEKDSISVYFPQSKVFLRDF